uniref:Uncharacterized protein n=1 Tax=Faecalibaculum rodentium TaxID=1702221 RepID=A0A140DS80_9FIRM|nr:hypothetical protein AALO17_03730 [Faecalibaculum rodentium]
MLIKRKPSANMSDTAGQNGMVIVTDPSLKTELCQAVFRLLGSGGSYRLMQRTI